MSKIRNVSARALTALAVAAAVVSFAVAGVTGAEAILQRQEAMEKVGESMGALAKIAKQEAPFDAAVVKASAETIAQELKKAAGLFPEGSEKGEVETWAKAEIWSDRAGFDKDLEGALAAAMAVQGVTEQGELMPALGALGGACKSCHQTYRRPKQ